MKAIVMSKYKKPLQTLEIAEPEVSPNQVLVRMIASGVNHADERLRRGELKMVLPVGLPKIMGCELSGEVVSVGEQVVGFRPGDLVYGYTGFTAMGTWAQSVAVEAEALAPVPRTTTLVEAAGLPVVALTAWQALVELGKMKSGQTVLIHGGGGGVGAMAIQLAKYLGVRVATTISANSLEVARALGADIIIDYRSENFVERLADTPVDLVVDTQGGGITERSLEVLRPGGMVVGLAGIPDPAIADSLGAGKLVKTALRVASARLRRKAGRLNVTYRFLFTRPDDTTLRKVSALVDDGVLRPSVGTVLPLEQAAVALQRVLAGHGSGKVVVAADPHAVNSGA